MNFVKLYISVNEKLEAVKFLQDRYFLFKTRNCSHWNTEMTLYWREKEERFMRNNRKFKKCVGKGKRANYCI